MILTGFKTILFNMGQFITKIIISYVCIMVVFLVNSKTINATDIPNAGSVYAMAVYSAKVYTSDIPDSEVNYNITDPAIISTFFQSIQNKRRDCSKLESMYGVYLYIKYNSGAYEVFGISGGYYVYFQSLENEICYWIYPEAREIIKNNIQE